MDPNNLQAALVDPGELPPGFSMAGAPDGSGEADAKAAKQAAVAEQKAMVLDQACTKEALARLGRIKLVKPEKAASVENSIVSMAMQGKLPMKITEDKLIEILERGSSLNSRGGAGGASGSGSISIQRKKYAFDSDDDEDDDEDLL